MTKKKIKTMPKTVVSLIITEKDLQLAYAVREAVFVEEQKVSREDEFDEFEEESFHFIAKIGGQVVGAARWRPTSEGIKLERFAVGVENRGKGVGKALVREVLNHIEESNAIGKLYLYAQLEAIPLYEHFGFKKVGKQFTECDIEHRTMELIR